jgi:hypothetical protein
VKTASGSVDEQESSRAVETPGRRPDRRRRQVLVAGVLVVAGGVAAAGWMIGNDPDKPASRENSGPEASATVQRQTLQQRTEVDGKLGYAGGYDVVNQANGVITNLPSVGKVIGAGHVLYRVDGKPVIFLRGDRSPAYRSLSEGMSGVDVRQLNAALVSLGYDAGYGPSADSDYFSAATADALQRLQDAVNVRETGTLDLGQAVFLPASKIRITVVRGTYGAGAPTGRSILQATSTTPKVSIPLDASLAAYVKAGDKVTVSLPNGKDAPGVVTSVGRVATTTASGSTIPIAVRLTDPKSSSGLDAASVKVAITSDSVKGVLAVPVTALLARSGGGYSVEVVEPGNARRLVPVKTGLFDDAAGLVEISGTGLAAGQRVVVPAT